MSRETPRTRARLWAWTYLAVFGPGEERPDEGDGESAADPRRSDDRSGAERD